MSKINKLFENDQHKPSTSTSSEFGLGQKNEQSHSGMQSCRLARNLDEILNDPTSLSYYINFLESIGQLHVIKFWLHVKGFCLSPTKLDAENIFNNYLKENMALAVELPMELVQDIYEQLFGSSRSALNADLFEKALSFIWDMMETRYLKKFLHSNFYAKYQLEIYENRQLTIMDVLNSHQLLAAFVEFLESKNQRNLLEFVIAVDSFIIELEKTECKNTKNAIEHQEDAMLIYDRFISMQATDPLGIDDDLRISVESGICTENGIPRKDAFNKTKEIVLRTLQKEFMPKFLNSNNFTRIFEETRQHAENYSRTFVMSNYENGLNRRFSNSSLPSSDRIGDTGWRKKEYFRNRSQTCDSDEVQKCDNKEVNRLQLEGQCKRNQKCSLLAKIDKFGRYTPLFDNTLIEDDIAGPRSSRSRLKNTLDRYLNQTAMKESVAADEMAELIIGEIQTMVISTKSLRK